MSGNTPKNTTNLSTLWKPGVSGNPNGRPRIDPAVKEAARALTLDAIAALQDALSATKLIGRDEIEAPDHGARISAANSLLDRAWGKPISADAMERDDESELRSKTTEELLEIVRKQS